MFGALALALVAVLIAGLAGYLHRQDHGAGRSSHAAGAAPSATASPSAAHAQAALIGGEGSDDVA